MRRTSMISKKFKLTIASAIALTAIGASLGIYLITGGSAQAAD
jgi:hypothetical protein